MPEEKNTPKKSFLSRIFRRDAEEIPPDDQPSDSAALEILPQENFDQPTGGSMPQAATPAESSPALPSFAEPEGVAAESAVSEATEGKRGFLQRLRERLGKTKTGLVDRVRQAISFHGKIDEELLDEIEMILIQADVGVETTQKILEDVRKNREARGINDPQELVPIIKESIRNIVSHSERVLKLREKPPTIILVVGVNGTGKTTTIGKLAKQFADAGKSVLMVAADTFRAAAIEQLTIWAERTQSQIFRRDMGADPSAVCFDALSSGAARAADVILIDTAGRLHTKSSLMEELRKINRVIKKVVPEAPHETILVLDATTGQNALSQAHLFREAVDLTGFVMTKLDGTAKGGILIALRDLLDIPVLKIGIGEGVEDFRDFDPDAFVDALFEEAP